MNGTVVSVLAGLSVGIGLLLIFGLFSTPVKSSEQVWMGRTPTQCSEPWDSKEWQVAPYGQSRTKVEAMTAFLENQGVAVFQTIVVEKSNFDGYKLVFLDRVLACASCSCTGSDTMFISIPNSNVSKLQNLGFAIYNGNFGEPLQNAILLADQLNETKDFKTQFASYQIHNQVTYLSGSRAESYVQDFGLSFLPIGKPAILVTYWVKLDVENSASLRVFINPDTGLTYGTHLYVTSFG